MKQRETDEAKQKFKQEWNAKLEQCADELENFFQQILMGHMLSGRKNDREEFEEQIEKEVIEYKEQIKEHLKQELIEQVEQFDKEQLKNKEQLETELIECMEQIENKWIAQKDHIEKDLMSGTLLYYALNKKNCHKRGHNEDVSETKYWSERCILILTNGPTATIFRQHNRFLYYAWCKEKKQKTDKQMKL